MLEPLRARPKPLSKTLERLYDFALKCDRDPKDIGLQSMVAPPPRNEEDKRFYMDPERVIARVVELKEMGFQWVSLNATAIFQRLLLKYR